MLLEIGYEPVVKESLGRLFNGSISRVRLWDGN
jgi:hypothetical protein